MKTKNYEKFTFMRTNRGINKGLVARLVKSIEEIGYIEARPVLVNESMVIIDGQHRFEACKQLGIPVVYEISPKINMHKAMTALNMNQQVWRLSEYIESWAHSGKKCYKDLLAFENKHGLGYSNNLAICHPSGASKKCNHIRSGVEFPINPNAEQIVEFVMGCKPYIHFYKEKHFVEAVVNLFKRTTEENRQRVLGKIETVRQQATINQYLTVFENIINKYKKGDCRVSLCVA